MKAIRSAWALLALGAIFLVGCTALAPGEVYAFDGETLDAQEDGKQGFGYSHFGITTFQDNDGDGLPDTRLRDFTNPQQGITGGVISVDDVTNGLATRDPAENPLSGAFYNDGGEGDVRARKENYFTTGLGNALTPAAAPKAAVKPPAIKPDRKMVYQGRMQVEVAQVDEAIGRYTAKVNEWGGHLGSRENATITVRVPAARFNEAVAELRGYGRVLSEAMQANDVTSQHLDLTIRLENAQKSRERLLALLQKAEKVEDMLKIEEQLHRLTEEIERMTGQLRFMNDQVAFSTLAIAFQGVAATQPGKRGRPASMFGWINRIGVEPLRRGF